MCDNLQFNHVNGFINLVDNNSDHTISFVKNMNQLMEDLIANNIKNVSKEGVVLDFGLTLNETLNELLTSIIEGIKKHSTLTVAGGYFPVRSPYSETLRKSKTKYYI